jgi:mannose/fructose-specific phosphotransferase system component IIA
MSDGYTAEGSGLAVGIVVTHGAMAHGIVDAVQKISGADADALLPVSNEGQGPESLVAQVTELASAVKGPVVIFTDLEVGSCALAARLVCREPCHRTVIFGINLPMLLDFVFHRDLDLEALEARLVRVGKAGIRTVETPSAPR